MIHAVIMAGGSGTRFWPESRRGKPKQLLSLAGERSMIEATIVRLGDVTSNVLVVTSESLVESLRRQLDLPSDAILGEPCRRDTAPCIGLAALWVMREDPGAIMIVMPADHVITTEAPFQDALRTAVSLVTRDEDQIITFGIKPSYAAESFGYVERADQDPTLANGLVTYPVARFHEKPSRETAESYLQQGTFYWNSGIFVWRASTILDQLRQHEPEMMDHLDRIGRAIGTADFPQIFAQQFEAIVGKSIDYAVMERAPKVTVIEAPFAWDDVGSWQSLARLRGQDADGNTIMARHLGLDCRGCIIWGPDDHLVATIGLEDCVIVHTENATLVARKDCEESVREIVKRLEAAKWTEYL